MKKTIFNSNIHNDLPLYCTLEKELGVHIEEVIYVNTQKKESAFTALFPSENILANAKNYMFKHGLSIEEIKPEQAKHIRKFEDTLNYLPAVIKDNIGDNRSIWFDKINLLFQLVKSHLYIIETEVSVKDNEFLDKLKSENIMLNYWDTAYGSDKRWSAVIPVGLKANSFTKIIKSHDINCIEAWKHDSMWEKIYAAIMSYARAILAAKGFYYDIEDIIHDQIEILLKRLEEESSNFELDEFKEVKLAKWLGAFFKAIIWRALNQKRKIRQRDTLIVKVAADYQSSLLCDVKYQEKFITDLNNKMLWAQAFSLLDDHERILFELRNNEFSVEEISQLLDKTNAWVKINLFRARKKVQQHFNTLGVNVSSL